MGTQISSAPWRIEIGMHKQLHCNGKGRRVHFEHSLVQTPRLNYFVGHWTVNQSVWHAKSQSEDLKWKEHLDGRERESVRKEIREE